jgi:hypothetical protein
VITNASFSGRGGRTLPGRVGGYHSYRSAGTGAVLVPYPIYYGYAPDYLYDQDAEVPAPVSSQGPSAPSVVINQNFISDHASPLVRTYGDTPDASMRMYQAPGPPAVEGQHSAAQNDEQPTIYLIAFRDHTIVPALAYWTEGNTLKYVNVDHSLNQATLDLIDRDMSSTLNQQRNVEFKLPAH